MLNAISSTLMCYLHLLTPIPATTAMTLLNRSIGWS